MFLFANNNDFRAHKFRRAHYTTILLITMPSAATTKAENIFMDRLSLLTQRQDGGVLDDVERNFSLRSPRQTKKAVERARSLLGSPSNKRKLHTIPLGSWIDFTEMPPSDECDSDISDSETEDDGHHIAEEVFRETRWSSTPSLANALFLTAPVRPLTRSVSIDTPMTLPARKRSFVDFNLMHP